jgi:broad specificity phosphatase PhoE
MVYVVRHAEKQDGSRDTALSDVGRARAAALARDLEGEEIDSILVTEYRRTLQTALALANARGIEPRVVAVGREEVRAHADRVVSAIREAGPGACVLVVGHSNTVPVILAALGVSESIVIGEEEFGRLYVVRHASIWGDGGGGGGAGRGAGRGRVELVVRRFGD